MARPQQDPTVNSLPGLVRAFREWARDSNLAEGPTVYGADEGERELLGALGGIAAEVGAERLAGWPAPVRDWAAAGPVPPDWLTESVRVELGRGNDALAALYNACVSMSNRRALGTVFTPEPVVDHMLGMVDAALDSAPARVVDPGAGVGAFTIAAARRWPQTPVHAVDVNVVTLGLLATRIAFEIDGQPEEAEALERIELVFGDYLDQLDRLYAPDAPGPMVAVGNPPYTRVQELSPADREKARDATAGMIDSGHANLAVVFQAATLARLREGDASCMVLPGSLSYTRASRGLRRALWASDREVEVQRWPATKRAFIGRSVQAAIVAVGPDRGKRAPLKLARVGLEGETVNVVERWTLSRRGEEPENWFWSGSLSGTERESTVPLSSIATVRRGVATGAKEMFFVTDAVAAKLPAEVTVPGVLSLRGFDDDVLDERAHASLGGPEGRRWLLSIRPERPLKGALAEYVEGFRLDVESRHLPSKRKPWYSIPLPVPPSLLIAPLAKWSFKVVVNAAGAIPSNNLFGIAAADEEEADAIAAWLRSDAGQEELRRVSRRYPGGSFKLEPASLAAARIPRNLQTRALQLQD